MIALVHRRWLLMTLVAAIVLGATLPAHAGYDKLWRFKNLTGTKQYNVLATLNGMEVISSHYKANYYRWWDPVNDYPPISATPGTAQLPIESIAVAAGVYDTTLFYHYPGTIIQADSVVKIGWSTPDHSCRLRGLVWADADGNPKVDGAGNPLGIIPSDVGTVPGGGTLTFDGQNYVWDIQNDTGGTLLLYNVEFQAFTLPFETDDLGEVAAGGVVGGLILALYQSVQAAWDDELLPDPSANSLLGKLYDAAEYNLAGFEYYGAGDVARARRSWDAAMRKVKSFVSELKTARDKDRVRDTEYEQWSTEAAHIMALLGETPPIEEPDPQYLPEGVPPSVPDGGSFQIAIPAGDVAVGDGLVVHGAVLDPTGTQILLDWVDQVEIKADLTAPTIDVDVTSADTGEPVSPNEADWYDEPVNVSLTAVDLAGPEGPAFGIRGMIVFVNGEPQGVAGGAATVEDLIMEGVSSWSGTYDHGIWEIAAAAIDLDGNISEVAVVSVQIDAEPPMIQASIDPPNLWPPDHTLRPMDLQVIVTDDNGDIFEPVVTINVSSNQPDEGTGDGDAPGDIQWGDDGTLYLRSERTANLQETRWYTIEVVATDVAGNVAKAYLAVPVAHDQGT